MRCRRCHTVFDDNRKACPNCGTLVRKRRGHVKLSPDSGVKVNPIVEFLEDAIMKYKKWLKQDSRALPISIGAPVLLIGLIILLFSLPSCTSCTTAPVSGTKAEYSALENSRRASPQFLTENGLCYISGDSLLLTSAEGMVRTIITEPGMSELYASGDFVYYKKDGALLRVSTATPLTLPGEEPPQAISEPVLSVSGSDLNEYLVAEGEVYCRVTDTGGESRLLHVLPDLSVETLMTGRFEQLGYYKGRLYYCREHTDPEMNTVENSEYIYSSLLDGSDERIVIDGQILHNYELGGGYLYYSGLKKDDTGAEHLVMCRYSLSTQTVTRMWAVDGLISYAASDSHLCYVIRDARGDSYYRVTHDSDEAQNIFFSANTTLLTGVSGNWFGFYDNLSAGENPYEEAKYYLVNSETSSIISCTGAAE